MNKKMTPQLNILLSFAGLILLGSILLVMPFSLKENVNHNYLDALFTATTSVTITGLTTVDVANTYNLFGKIIIAILIQLGGLSITTISYFLLVIIGSKIGFSDRDLIKENINIDTRQGVIKTLLIIIKITAIIEIVGVFIFTIFFMSDGYNFIQSLGYAFFHTISSFNNAGITIFYNSSNLVKYTNNYLFNIITAALITLGGLGSLVIYDLIKNKRWKNLNYHTKIVLKMSLILFLVGFTTFYLFEPSATILQSIFHSVTIRTAGFYSYNYLTVKSATLLVTMSLMFIGGAPASTAGGIKVTTIYTSIKSVVANLFNKKAVAYNRKIPERYERKSFAIIFLSLITLFLSVTLISVFNQSFSLSSIMFEVFSAMSNTGLSLNLTSELTNISQIILIFLMFVGRLGILTFVYAIIKKDNKITGVDYLEIDYLL